MSIRFHSQFLKANNAPATWTKGASNGSISLWMCLVFGSLHLVLSLRS